MAKVKHRTDVVGFFANDDTVATSAALQSNKTTNGPSNDAALHDPRLDCRVRRRCPHRIIRHGSLPNQAQGGIRRVPLAQAPRPRSTFSFDSNVSLDLDQCKIFPTGVRSAAFASPSGSASTTRRGMNRRFPRTRGGCWKAISPRKC
jgi:hypothetical protein